MTLAHFDVVDFRNILSIEFDPLSVGFNFIYGLNGSGKTSLLESIYYLSRGRSFRSSAISRIIRRETNKFRVVAQIRTNEGQLYPVGIERQLQGDLKIRIAGKDVHSAAELAHLIPVQLINSHCYNLLDAGPSFRRKFLDWGVFYLNNAFLRVWRDYGLALKQRNAALRKFRPQKELDSWSKELANHAARLNEFRQDYIQLLLPLLNDTLPQLLNVSGLEMTYLPGWDDAQDYYELLSASYGKDSQLGHTQFGPHRADLKITINNISAKDILSRGQQKLFVCAMMLAQGALLQKGVNKKPIYLIDDLPAELDKVSRSNLIALLSKQETQIFVTAVEKSALSDSLSTVPVKMFHVEHGNLTEVT
ncbi:MAG: DNA replication/repair protein RecF [Gammaproteobacteria bacterium]|nr:DNA replication/repair protein RecF [Gammaproteobacteria bacterium]